MVKIQSSSPLKDKDSYHHAHLLDTETTDAQVETMQECQPFFIDLTTLPASQLDHLQQVGLMVNDSDNICLVYHKHEQYLYKAFGNLPGSFTTLDASRPWMIYWCLHSCDLMDKLPPESVLIQIIHTLQTCWNLSSNSQGGGFGGGFGQLPHCATTYAAILALTIIATTPDRTIASHMAMELLRNKKQYLAPWWKQLQEHNGGFRMHIDGEIDVRASYCILSCAKLLHIPFTTITSTSTLTSTVQFIANCQTYEGGFGGEPGTEAHGGYTFCAIAALALLDHLSDTTIDLPTLQGWLVRRQMPYEGGFQGRSNKLVDGCYSFWQGGALAILSQLDNTSTLLMDEGLLQRYILLCAQDVNGGLRDKPSKSRDFYHSCYNLSGLSVSQHCGELKFGHATKSKLHATHPIYNIRVERVTFMLETFEDCFP